jgi:hypothetical protein
MNLSITCVIALIWVTTTPAQGEAQPLVRGIDHIPVAVTDLERSAADFQALGFTLKPGRPMKMGCAMRM